MLCMLVLNLQYYSACRVVWPLTCVVGCQGSQYPPGLHQQALLEVIEDYFTSPDNADEEDGIEDDMTAAFLAVHIANSLEGNVGLLYHSVR